MRRSITILSLALVAALVLLPAAASTQEPPPRPRANPSPTPPVKEVEQEIDPEDVISVNTTEILLPVTVRDNTGKLVPNLTRSEFQVFEDGVEQPLSDLSLRQAPVDVALIVDASSSVADNLDDFRHAAEGFASYLAEEDRLCLIQFDDKVTLVAGLDQEHGPVAPCIATNCAGNVYTVSRCNAAGVTGSSAAGRCAPRDHRTHRRH